MNITVQIRNSTEIQLLYSAEKFTTGLNVTGYLIYPDLSKSSVLTFNELGDGIYVAMFPYTRKTTELDEKYGIVVKENGITKHFDFIKLIN